MNDKKNKKNCPSCGSGSKKQDQHEDKEMRRKLASDMPHSSSKP